jgi:hypothetical protein
MRFVLIALLSVFVVYILAEIVFDPAQRQWDFRTYYYAASVQASGGNPYDAAELNRRSGGLTVLPFIYPPPTLAFFRLFAAVPFDTAYQLWLALKILLGGGLIFLWRKYLFPDEPAFTFYLFLLLAFGATFYIDFVTGNVTIIEQALLWLGIVLLLRGRPLEFCAALLVASAFKLTPVIFVFLLPLLNVRHAWRYLAGTAGVTVAAGGLSYMLDAAAWREFVTRMPVADEAGNLGNPSSLSLCRDLVASVAEKLGTTAPDAVPLAIYILAMALILWFSARSYRDIKRSACPDSSQLIVYLSCLAFALVMPRFKTYSFMLLLPPALCVIRSSRQLPAFGFLFALVALCASTPFPISPYLRMFWLYYPLLITVMIWLLLILSVRTRYPPPSA